MLPVNNSVLTSFCFLLNLSPMICHAQLAKDMNASEQAMSEALPAALLSKAKGNVISQGLSLLNDDLTFAEDLLLVSDNNKHTL